MEAVTPEGLRRLADFLEANPEVPRPTSVVAYHPAGNAADVLPLVEAGAEVKSGVISTDRKVTIEFDGCQFAVNVPAEVIGEVREVQTVTREFTPFSLDELRAKAAGGEDVAQVDTALAEVQ